MCEHLHYESVYFKELHNEQEYYCPTIYRAGAAVVSTITSYIEVRYIEVHRLLFQYIVYSRGLRAESKVCSEHMNDWQWTICTKEVT